MDEMHNKITQVRNKLIHMSNITMPTNVKHLANRKLKIQFAEDYLAELHEFEQQLNISQIEANFTVKIVAENVFFRYLQKFQHTIVFDGSYIQAALCNDMFIVHFCATSL